MNYETARQIVDHLLKEWDMESELAPWYRELAARKLVKFVGDREEALVTTHEHIYSVFPETSGAAYVCTICGHRSTLTIKTT